MWAELPAKTSQSQDCEREWRETVATSPLNFFVLLNAYAPGGWFGRMSPASFQAYPTSLPIHVRRNHQWIWNATEQRWKLKTSTVQKSYTRSTASWPDFQNSGTGSLTEFWTLNTSEWTGLEGLSLKDAGVCSLSDILEIGAVPQRYFLSARACAGILRRAEKRGKDLPRPLALALQAVAASAPTSTAAEG
ncbi:hypothetical protein GCM10008965_00020 [Methylorubrum aminovorans]|nr:hypothetical protein GCM10025880_00490 [Methylorubrum aminovorans]GMA79818.1 hypothetical protein GCM10025880_62350 [Methylorubrum aminovorans]